jgi:ABC-type sugar transport system, periplasmic component
MKRLKRILATILAAVTLLLPLSACDSDQRNGKVETIKIGVAVYRKDDTFVSSLCSYLEQIAKDREIKSGKKIVVNIVDGQSSQALQDDQVDSFISRNYNVICVNEVDRTAAAVIVNKAKAAGIPLIFFNREPVEEDLRMWDRAYYVGADAAESGRLQGEIIAKAFKKNPALIDKNGDGKIQYGMLEGEQEHQDALLRTEYSIKAVTSAGIPVEKLADDIANWQRAQGTAKMMQWIKKFDNRVEVVFCNNDDMALGVIDAIRDSKQKINPVVVGIDGTQNGLKAVEDGTMYGTVFNDAKGQAQAIFDLAYSFTPGGGSSSSIKMEKDHYITVPYWAVTKDNIDKALEALRQ